MRPWRALLAELLVCTMAACVVAFAACDDGDQAQSVDVNPPLVTIEVRYDGGTLRVEVARSAEQRRIGLGGRPSLDDDAGMLFDLGQTTTPSFWMKGMRFAIDFGFLDEEGRIISIAAHARPEPGVPDTRLRRYSAPSPARYVLELNAGAFERRGLAPGDQLSFELPRP